MKNMLLLFERSAKPRAKRTAPVPAKRAQRDRRETKTALATDLKGGAGSKHQERHPFPPTFGFS